jgi:O-6-methylguanine DNA methyltransferase
MRNDRTPIASAAPIFHNSFMSPIGLIYVALDDKKVIALSFTSRDEQEFLWEISLKWERPLRRSVNATKLLVSELREYFEGTRRRFSFSADFSQCTDFQRKVLLKTAAIPYGQTRTYGWLAQQAGSPGASRAAGQVMARNPVPIIVPCHRVLGSSGELRGFAGGLRALDLKRALLEIEGIRA